MSTEHRADHGGQQWPDTGVAHPGRRRGSGTPGQNLQETPQVTISSLGERSWCGCRVRRTRPRRGKMASAGTAFR